MNRKYFIIKKLVTLFLITIFIFSIAANSTMSLTTNKTATNNFESYSREKQNTRDSNWPILNNFLRPLNRISNNLDIFTSNILTICNGIEKSSSISFGSYNDIDVDDDENTGINGADIRVQYLILPWIQFEPDLAIGAIFTVGVERLGNEIIDKDFEIYAEVGFRDIKIGYSCPNIPENEIPKMTRISFMLLFLLQKNTAGFGVFLGPEYESGNENKTLELFSEFNDNNKYQRLSVEYDPAIETQVNLIKEKEEGKWEYQFTRSSSANSRVTTRFSSEENEVEKEISFVIDELPAELIFSLSLTPLSQGGGQLLFESDSSYDVEILISSNVLGICPYATIIDTPNRIFAQWLPTLNEGFYKLQIDSPGTDIIIQNNLTEPTRILTINDLQTIDIDAYWNLTNPGDFTVYKNTDMNLDLDIKLDDWDADLFAQPQAGYISSRWLIDVTGYISIDTNNEFMNTIDLLIKSEDLGLHTDGDSFSAEDFYIEWTLWPPADWDLDVTGEIVFSEIAIDLFLSGDWYHLWPW